MGRFIVLALFLAAIIFFLLPWATVSCAGTEVISTSGFDLVRGSYDVPIGTSGVTAENEPIAIGVLTAAAVGLVISIFRGGIWRLLRALAGLAGVGLMIWLYFKMSDEIASQGQGLLDLNLQIGAWLTIAALALAAIVSLIVKDSWGQRLNAASPARTGPPPSGTPPPPPG
ncbi:MAG: hypothetical protein PHG35_06545 [Dehalococcoidales bacterium]|nr:hypothetical protein [Dehalococcoidales bacterium]